MTKILKIIGKNILAFLTGAIVGIIIVVTLIVPYALKEAIADKEPGAVIAGAIALPPVFLIIYGVFGVIIGGFSAIIIYNIARLILKRKK